MIPFSLSTYLIAGALVLALIGGLYVRGNMLAAKLETSERDRATLTANNALLTRQGERAVAGLEQVARDRQADRLALTQARTILSAAPPSSVCVAHPGWRALRGSLRPADAAPAAPQPAAQPGRALSGASHAH